jgi:uncharacterized protein YcbK (DUF882 family)
MVCITEIQHTDEEDSEHLQLDDYNIDNLLGQYTDTMMKYDDPELPDHVHNIEDVVKIEDEDDVQSERRRFRNAKHTKHRKHTMERQQHQPGDLYDFSMTNLHNIINISRDACNIIIARQQERVEVEA